MTVSLPLGMYPPAYPLITVKCVQGKSFFYVMEDDGRLDEMERIFSFLLPTYTLLIFPAFDCLPYDRTSPSQDILARRMDTLLRLLNASKNSTSAPLCVILSVSALLQKVPAPTEFSKTQLVLSLGDTVDRETLLIHLHDQGFMRTETVYEVGDYAVRGGIIDVFPASERAPVRLDFLGDELESLRSFDIATQKTVKEVLEITLQPVSELMLNERTITRFRENFRHHAAKDCLTHPLYIALSEGRSYPGMEHFLPLFYDTMVPILDYLPTAELVMEGGVENGVITEFSRIHTYFKERQHVGIGERPYSPLSPTSLYIHEGTWENVLHKRLMLEGVTKGKISGISEQEKSSEKIDASAPFILGGGDEEKGTHLLELSENHTIIIGCENKARADRVTQFFHDQGIHRIQFQEALPKYFGLYTALFPVMESFTFGTFIFISASVFIGVREKKKHTKTKNIDRFFKELNTYSLGDFLVHRDHGVARYLGLETVDVDRKKHDCIVLEYAESSKLFLPVEHMDVLSHFAKEDSSVDLDKLGTALWQHKKARVKKKLLDMAEALLKIAAERHLKTAPEVYIHGDTYSKFCQGFPYMETEDQSRAIVEVESDLGETKPMDRLICGDVGFGKTEVALRAAFLAIQSGLQVLLVVPTTLLARQHFATFLNRFKGFPYRIEMLCRLVSPKKATSILHDFESGQVHMIIATHAAFSTKMKPANLGLLIIDEEQHFGVKQKEKIKTLKQDVHILTLSATPIPRTLQMSLTGIRDLSLITTPPVDRIPVKTFVLEQDFTLLRDVILREYNRGGQIFFVTPRLNDIPNLLEKLSKAVPEIKMGVAHGRMPPSDLEDVVQDFYDHKYDLLLSTNIIESGIDIPNANTLIVHKAHLFGLAQLYQIRGRIGRGKKQAYAYLTVPFDHALSDNALKRLKILQSLDHLGAGFHLASHDLDMRGGGNLVGEEQSGHVREVGVELYQHMLQEAILAVRAKEHNAERDNNQISVEKEFSPILNLGLSVLIPEVYVGDLSLRLGLYKRIALLATSFDIDDFRTEMVDRFGPLPVEMDNLLKVVLIKQYCLMAGIEKLDAGEKGIVISFFKNTFKNPGALLNFMEKQAGKLKLRPDHKLVFMADLKSPEKRTQVAEKLTKIMASMVSGWV